MAVRKIGAEVMLGGEKEFNSALKAVNSNLKTLRSDMSAVSSEFRENENSTEALIAKQKLLQETYDQQKEVVDVLTKRHKAMLEKYGEESSQADKARQALNKATVDMNKTQDALDDTSEEIKKQTSLLGRLRGAYEAVPDGAKKAFSAVARGAAKLAAANAAVGVTAAGVLGGIAVAGLKTVGSFATDAAERAKESYAQANELAEQARQAALSGNADAAAEYQRQASELMDSVDGNYYRLSQNMEHFQQAQTTAKDAIGSILLPALSELSGNGAALLNEFSEAMARTNGDTEKMGEVIGTYLIQAVELVSHMVPDFMQLGGDLLGGLLQGIDESLPQILDSGDAIVDELINSLLLYAPNLGEGAVEIISRLALALIDHAPEFIVGGAVLIAKLLEGLAAHIPELVTAIMALPGQLLDAFVEADVDWASIGINIVTGIWNGFVSMWDSFTGWVSNALDRLFGSVQAHEEIHSPSRKWDRGVGSRMAQGVGTGFVREMNKIKRDVQTSVDGLLPAPPGGGIRPGLPFDVSGGGSTTNMGGVVINININGYQVQSDQELAERISYELNQLMNRRGA